MFFLRFCLHTSYCAWIIRKGDYSLHICVYVLARDDLYSLCFSLCVCMCIHLLFHWCSGLARLPLVNTYARTPPVVWRLGWSPSPVGSHRTQLPPLPVEFLQEKDVLKEFVTRINTLGQHWSTILFNTNVVPCITISMWHIDDMFLMGFFVNWNRSVSITCYCPHL